MTGKWRFHGGKRVKCRRKNKFRGLRHNRTSQETHKKSPICTENVSILRSLKFLEPRFQTILASQLQQNFGKFHRGTAQQAGPKYFLLKPTGNFCKKDQCNPILSANLAQFTTSHELLSCEVSLQEEVKTVHENGQWGTFLYRIKPFQNDKTNF